MAVLKEEYIKQSNKASETSAKFSVLFKTCMTHYLVVSAASFKYMQILFSIFEDTRGITYLQVKSTAVMI